MPEKREKKSALFITKEMSHINGRTLYSQNLRRIIFDIAERHDLCKIQVFESKKRKVFLRALFILLLLPPIWIDSLQNGFRILKYLRNKKNKEYSHLFIDHMQLWWLIIPLKLIFSDARMILVSHNLEYRAKISYLKYAPLLFAILSLFEVLHLFLWESLCTRLSDGVICINGKEREFFASIIGENNTCVIYPFVEEDELSQTKNRMEEKKVDSLLLVGSYSYKAKELNAIWLIKDIMPRVNSLFPEVQLNLVGRGVTNKMIHIAQDMSYINIIGEVEKLNDWYAGSCCVIIPERLGGGFKLKIIEAALFGRPMILHSEAVRGTFFTDGEDCLVFTTPQECIESITRLYSDLELRQKLVQNSFIKLMKYHTSERAKTELEKILRN